MRKPDPAAIRAAWERYHGPIAELDGYIPATPPTYERGYRDGLAEFAQEAARRLHDDSLGMCEDDAAITLSNAETILRLAGLPDWSGGEQNDD